MKLDRDNVLDLSQGNGRDSKAWRPWKPTVHELIDKCTHHIMGSKDGPAFLQCALATQERVSRVAQTISIIGFDVDDGTPSEQLDTIIKQRGLFAIRYTTHSHRKNCTEINSDMYVKYTSLNSGATLSDFLIDNKHYRKEIAESAEIAETKLTPAGRILVVNHEPMDRNRLILILNKPWKQEDYFLQKDALDDWKRRYTNLAHYLGIKIDKSCTDVTRLFYFPRMEKGHPFEAVVHDGQAVDIFAFPDIQAGDSKGKLNTYEAAGTVMGATSNDTASRRLLKQWAVNHNQTLLLADLVKSHAEQYLRPQMDKNDKYHIECPFEQEHTTHGGHGTFIMNAGESSHGSFVINCQHNSCKERDKLDFIQKMISDEWFTYRDLRDPQFNLELQEQTAQEQVEEVSNTEPKKLTQEQICSLLKKVITPISKIESKTVQQMKLKDAQELLSKSGLRTTVPNLRKELNSILKSQKNQEDKAEELFDRGKTKIYLSMDFSKQQQLVLKCLLKFNEKTPILFKTAIEYIRVVSNNRGKREIRRLTDGGLRNVLKDLCSFIVTTPDGGQREVPPPLDNCRDILETPNLPFPYLQAIANTPMFGADGKIRTKDGYDDSTQMYISLQGLKIGPIKENPTYTQVQESVKILLEQVYIDFPFDGPNNGQAERSHALAMLLQPFVREMIKGSTPIYAVFKTTPGTGGSKLVDSFSLITSGKLATAQTEPSSDEEMRKRITSVLSSGQTVLYLDNINSKLDSGSLASVVTAGQWTDRVLGKSEMTKMPAKLLWIIAGNNIDISPELTRRCIRIRLDAKVEHPELRTKFRHSDLEGYIEKNRAELVRACLTIIQYWVSQKQPAFKGKLKGSFENWSRVIGGILQTAGVKGFLENDKEMREQMDNEGLETRAFITAWYNNFKFKDVFVGASTSMADKSLYDMLNDQNLSLPIAGHTDQAKKRTLGTYIGKKLNGRVFTIDNAQTRVTVIVEKSKSVNNAIKWKLTPKE